MPEVSVVESVLREVAPRRLRPREFANHQEYYWTYQYSLAKYYLCPVLEEWGFDFTGKRILDVGCGNGGIACALADRGARCLGIDIEDMEKPHVGARAVEFRVGDINQPQTLRPLEGQFDLAILRDVIEHIDTKETFLRNVLSALAPGGKLFMTFPPYYSPFGGHTQLLRAKVFKLPYVSWLPAPVLGRLVRAAEPPHPLRDEVLRLNDIRTTVGQVERVLGALPVEVLQRKFYALRPTFHIRYGVRPRGAFWGSVPVLNEFATTAVFYYLEKKSVAV